MQLNSMEPVSMPDIGNASNGSTAAGISPYLACVPCLMRQAQEAIELATADTAVREAALRQTLRLLAELDWQDPPPVMSREVHRLIRGVTRCADPYAGVKETLNRRAWEIYPVWHHRFRRMYAPLEAAVRMAIVGNLLDVGAKTQLDAVAVEEAFEKALTEPLLGSVAEFGELIGRAGRILYLADNAGEIVFDRDLIAQLPLGRFALAVRGRPVLNDATLADAEQAGLAEVCEIIPNGSDAPGTILEDCSREFRAHFDAADVVIAKGQGNYESLMQLDRPIVFLLKVKCPVLAGALGCPAGSLVLRHHA